MSDNQQPQEPVKKVKRPVPPTPAPKMGSVADQLAGRFGVFGGGKHPDVQPSDSVDTQTLERSDVQTSTSLNVQTGRSPEGENASMSAVQTASTSNVKKSKHPGWKQQTVYLPPELLRRIKHRIADTGEEISDVANKALQAFLEREEGR